MYASVVRRRMSLPKPEQLCIGVNGHWLKVKHYDSDEVLLELPFRDFRDGNPDFVRLKSLLGRDALRIALEQQPSLSEPWRPIDPTKEEIKATFQQCHDRIWKRESLFPTAAFYEFTKLVFLKLREDERLHRIMDSGKAVELKDLHFHTEWIDNTSEVSPNPVNSILFRQLVEDLEEQVRKNRKKPIFGANEQIRLKPSTIRSVVGLLQNYDLFGIDEDLNGRMFEIFLSAAVRGKNLGAFFTPRNIVELMVNMTGPSVSRTGGQTHIETVLDGCCGSGGFLIDAMATMIRQIRGNPTLSPHAQELEEALLAQHLYGIDSNPDIARIARINMFLHGDGGSRIYRVDCLDKDFYLEEGEAYATQDEIKELRDLLVGEGKQFDVVLTNPPFASSYTTKDEHEARILGLYPDLLASAGGKPKSAAKSNVLFLARYYELLRPGGRMAIILDNSMLNSQTFYDYRIWLRERFIIRAIISLPKYSFIQAGAGGVTSLAYLEKRSHDGQAQPPIFARTVQYTGISKSGKEIEQNDLPDVLAEWQVFERSGKLFLKGTYPLNDRETDDLFLIFPDDIHDRLDVSIHSPSYTRLMSEIEEMGRSGTQELKRISDLTLANKVSGEEAVDRVYQDVDIGAVDAERCQIVMGEVQEGTLEELTDRARVLLKENDVIFPLSFDSLGKVAIVPASLDGELASTGFTVIRNQSYDEAVLLWSIVRSALVQKQFHHVASGYTQRGISKEHLGDVVFPIPVANRSSLTDAVKRLLTDAGRSRQGEVAALGAISSMMDSALTQ